MDDREAALMNAHVVLEGRRITVSSETTESLVLVEEHDEPADELVALGFECEERAVTTDRNGRVINLNYESPWRVYVYSLELRKTNPRLTGPFLYCVEWEGQLVRIAAEVGDRVLAVTNPYLFGSTRGFTEVVNHRDGKNVCFRWLARDEVQRPEPLTDLEYVHTAPFRVLLRDSGVPQGFGIDVETPDAFVLVVEGDHQRPDLDAAGFIVERSYDVHTGHDLFIYTQTVKKTDPRLTGFYDFVEYRGYKLRVIDRNGEGALAIAHGPLAQILGFATHDLVAYGRVQDPD